jgi:hypothetical protein
MKKMYGGTIEEKLNEVKKMFLTWSVLKRTLLTADNFLSEFDRVSLDLYFHSPIRLSYMGCCIITWAQGQIYHLHVGSKINLGLFSYFSHKPMPDASPCIIFRLIIT